MSAERKIIKLGSFVVDANEIVMVQTVLAHRVVSFILRGNPVNYSTTCASPQVAQELADYLETGMRTGVWE